MIPSSLFMPPPLHAGQPHRTLPTTAPLAPHTVVPRPGPLPFPLVPPLHAVVSTPPCLCPHWQLLSNFPPLSLSMPPCFLAYRPAASTPPYHWPIWALLRHFAYLSTHLFASMPPSLSTPPSSHMPWCAMLPSLPQASRIDPSLPLPHLGLAQWYLGQGLQDGSGVINASSELETAIKAAPSFYDALKVSV